MARPPRRWRAGVRRRPSRAVSHEYRRGRAWRLRASAARRAAACLSSSHFLSSPRCSTWPGVWRSIASRRRRDTAAACRTTRASAPPSTTSSRGAGPAELDHGRSTKRMKRLCAILGVLVLALVSVGTAAAEDGGGAGQVAGQSAGSGQSAGGSSGASQVGPTNSATSIRVLSPGNERCGDAVEHHDCGSHRRERQHDEARAPTSRRPEAVTAPMRRRSPARRRRTRSRQMPTPRQCRLHRATMRCRSAFSAPVTTAT